MGFFDFFRPAPSKPDVRGSVSADILRVILHVKWATPEEIDKLMPGKLAFCKGPDMLGDGEYHAWITAPKPRDFNDHDRMETLGHEVFHALGGKHA